MKYLIPFFILTAFYTSCTCKQDERCYSEGIRINLVGFDTSEVDSMITISYQPNNLFDSVIDTQKYHFKFNYQYNCQPGKDTLQASVGGGYNYKNYRLIFPKAGRILNFYNFEEIGGDIQNIKVACKDQGEPHSCRKKLISFIVNGQKINPSRDNCGNAYHTMVK